MMYKIGILLLFCWVIIGAWILEPPMNSVSNPEIYRIFYFHVPIALVTFIAYGISMYQGILYLKTRRLTHDMKSSSAAALGTLYCILATISGSIFAKMTWGSFWNWDPRETSIVVLLLIYLAYFSLRSAIPDRVRRANLSSVYSVLGFLAAIFAIFIWPRITPGLHPGSAGDSPGAVISMSGTTWMVFGPSLLAFFGLYYWIYDITVRVGVLQEEKIK